MTSAGKLIVAETSGRVAGGAVNVSAFTRRGVGDSGVASAPVGSVDSFSTLRSTTGVSTAASLLDECEEPLPANPGVLGGNPVRSGWGAGCVTAPGATGKVAGALLCTSAMLIPAPESDGGSESLRTTGSFDTTGRAIVCGSEIPNAGEAPSGKFRGAATAAGFATGRSDVASTFENAWTGPSAEFGVVNCLECDSKTRGWGRDSVSCGASTVRSGSRTGRSVVGSGAGKDTVLAGSDSARIAARLPSGFDIGCDVTSDWGSIRAGASDSSRGEVSNVGNGCADRAAGPEARVYDVCPGVGAGVWKSAGTLVTGSVKCTGDSIAFEGLGTNEPAVCGGRSVRPGSPVGTDSTFACTTGRDARLSDGTLSDEPTTARDSTAGCRWVACWSQLSPAVRDTVGSEAGV